MEAKDAEFLNRLQATFRVEAEEHVRALSSGLIELEKLPAAERGAEVLESVFREAHSLKGAARSVNRKEIESLCQPMEGALAALKRRAIAPSPALLDLLHQTVDHIARLVASSNALQTPANQSRVRELIGQLEDASRGAAPPRRMEESGSVAEASAIMAVLPTAAAPAPPSPREAPVASSRPATEHLLPTEIVRVPTAKLDPLLFQAEEMIPAKMAAGQRAADLQTILHALDSWKAESPPWKDRPPDAGAPPWEEWSKWHETRLNAIQDLVAAAARAVEQDHRALRRMVDEHLEAMKQVLMLPVSSLVEIFPKVVRDLARNQGKEAELVVRGAEIEMDKRILEELKDPLLHLLRNGVDHGIEKPEERARRGKPPRGTIALAFVAKDGRQVEILVSEDGAGIDLDQVRSAAIQAGLVSREAAGQLDPQQALSLIFLSGVTTSPIITDISGRGLGLAIVREKVEKLGGVVSVDNRIGAGTTFRLLLPLTLATVRGVLVRVGEHLFILPTLHVDRAVRVRREEIETVEGRETIRLDGQILSTVRLGDALELPARRNGASAPAATASYIPVVVVASTDRRIAFQVDEVLGEHQVPVKPLGRQLSRVRNITGATILGTGKVVPVLNVPDLMKSAVRSAADASPAADAAQSPAKAGRILVAEDSITARSLLKNILETAGYQVATAVDGADAFTQARTGEFDLIVSDVDMPRMNGFELTTRIRDDKKLGELPVVLVTALESREDRERGIEAGANAYIVKSSFDQSNLLDVIHRLL